MKKPHLIIFLLSSLTVFAQEDLDVVQIETKDISKTTSIALEADKNRHRATWPNCGEQQTWDSTPQTWPCTPRREHSLT